MESTAARSDWIECELSDGLRIRAVDRPSLAKLMAILRLVWRDLPAKDRKLLCDYLNQECPGIAAGLTIDVHDLKAPTRNQIAAMEDDGRRLWFSARLLAEMPDDAVIWILAHELAHSFQYACLFAAGHLSTGVPDCQSTEDEADQIAIRWGFAKARDAKQAWWAPREAMRRLQQHRDASGSDIP